MKITDSVDQLKLVENRLLLLEAHVKETTAQVHILRHDFNGIQQVVKLLVEEIDQRLPITPAATKS